MSIRAAEPWVQERVTKLRLETEVVTIFIFTASMDMKLSTVASRVLLGVRVLLGAYTVLYRGPAEFTLLDCGVVSRAFPSGGGKRF